MLISPISIVWHSCEILWASYAMHPVMQHSLYPSYPLIALGSASCLQTFLPGTWLKPWNDHWQRWTKLPCPTASSALKVLQFTKKANKSQVKQLKEMIFYEAIQSYRHILMSFNAVSWTSCQACDSKCQAWTLRFCWFYFHKRTHMDL